MALTIKQKEPKLSEEMQKILKQSQEGGKDYCGNELARYKYKIMQLLTQNQDILWTLNNKDLEKQKKIITNDNGDKTEYLNGDLYRYVNIFDFLRIPDIQSEVENYVCFEVHDVETPRYNKDFIIKNIVFRTLSTDKGYITDWGISRHDLLAVIIQTQFDWSNIFGTHIEKVSDYGESINVGRSLNKDFYYREFVYEQKIPNSPANKFRNGGLKEDYGAFRL